MRKKPFHPAKTEAELLDEFRQLQLKGATPEEICRLCEGLSPVLTIRILRSLWPLSLMEAKELLVRRDTGMSLNDYQEKLVDELEAAWEKEE